jgi:nucleotide-binding universal stress UspA family protein
MSFSRILVPLDGSPLAEGALVHAVRLARAFDARLLLLQVLQTLSSITGHGAESVDWRLRKLEITSYLKSVAGRLAQDGVKAEWYLSEGRPAAEITEFTRTHGIDLTVLNAYGWGGISEFPFGGTVHKVISAPGVSCFIARPGGDLEASAPGYRRILVPLDGSQRAEWAANMAVCLARGQDTEVVLLQVIPVPDMPRRVAVTREEAQIREKFVEYNRRAANHYLTEVQERLADSVPVRTRLDISPRVVSMIRKVADDENADLVVLTAHGNAGPNGVTQGTVSQALLAYCNRPVLVLRSDAVGAQQLQSTPESVDWSERKLCAME